VLAITSIRNLEGHSETSDQADVFLFEGARFAPAGKDLDFDAELEHGRRCIDAIVIQLAGRLVRARFGRQRHPFFFFPAGCGRSGTTNDP